MFTVGQKIVYSSNGVCTVADICNSPFNKSDNRSYYLLVPMISKGNTKLYVPLEGTVVNMRELMSADEARLLLESVSGADSIVIEHEKHRRDTYKQTVSLGEPSGYVRLIKTVHERRLSFVQARKRLPEIDSHFDKIARTALFSELATVLELPLEEIESQIENALVK